MHIDMFSLVFIVGVCFALMALIATQMSHAREARMQLLKKDFQMLDMSAELASAKLKIQSLDERLKEVTVSPAHVENFRIDGTIKSKPESEW